jgi:group I intron endonuclease
MGLIYGIKYQDKIIYVGQTIRKLKNRISQYKSQIKQSSQRQYYILNHLRKHFDESEFIVLHEQKEGEDLDILEKYYIKEYNTIAPNGMNLTDGGGSCKISDISKEKMSKSRLGKIPWNKDTRGVMKAWNKGIKGPPQSEEVRNKKKRFGDENHFFGKTHSDETKKKISESKKGKSEAHNKIKGKVYQYDKDMNLICTYEDISEAVKAGYDSSSISRSHREKNRHKGFYFIRENYDDR